MIRYYATAVEAQNHWHWRSKRGAEKKEDKGKQFSEHIIFISDESHFKQRV